MFNFIKIYQMKTILQWMQELPESQRKQALHNMTLYPYMPHSTEVDSLKSALLRAFVWGRGNGTAQYWSDVYNGNNNQLF